MMHLGKLINGSATRVGVSRLHRELAISSELFEASQCDPAGVLGRLGCTDAGLDETEAARRLKRFGLNQIARERRTGVIYELINRTKNPLNVLLLTLAVISYFLGDVRPAIVIATMVLLSIFTAFIQEHRSNQAAAKLRALVKTTASVKRQGQSTRHDSGGPARALGQGPLRQPVGPYRRGDAGREIRARRDRSRGRPVLSSKYLLHGNIVSGYATGVIVKTGASSYFGRLVDRIAGQRIQTSFEKGIDRFTWLMIRFILVLVPSVFLINGISKGDWLEALLFALAVAVGLTWKCCR
jgi:P-type Mg2+ transporter